MSKKKILWYSIPSLHDTSNGAAISSKLMLEQLVQRGYEVIALNCYVGDDTQGLGELAALKAELDKRQPQAKDANPFNFIQNGVSYFIYRTESTAMDQIKAREQSKLFTFFTQVLTAYQPDLLMGYSGDIFSTCIWREAAARGIPMAYNLCNGLHAEYAFPNCDLVFTTSQATSDLYAERDGMDVKHVGVFIDRQKVFAPERAPRYVTLINPTPEKGIAIFSKLTEVFGKRHPEVKFLVVKSVGNYQAICSQLHDKDGNHPYIYGKEWPWTNIDIAEHTNDIKQVYAITKVLVCPSVWHESWGMVATEANINGIPVLATTGNGLHEAIADKGGLLLKAPDSTQNDFFCLPSDEEIEPFVQALERLLAEDWTDICHEAAEANALEKTMDRLTALLDPLIEKGQKEKQPTSRSFYFNQKTMDRIHKVALDAKIGQKKD